MLISIKITGKILFSVCFARSIIDAFPLWIRLVIFQLVSENLYHENNLFHDYLNRGGVRNRRLRAIG